MVKRHISRRVEGDVSRPSSFSSLRKIDDLQRLSTTAPPELKQGRQSPFVCIVETILPGQSKTKGANNRRNCSLFDNGPKENRETAPVGTTVRSSPEPVKPVVEEIRIAKLQLPGHKSASLEIKNQSFTLNLPGGQSVDIRTNLEISLLLAVIRKESTFIPSKTSPKDCKGLMQISDDVSRLYRVRDPYNPTENIRAGSLYLSAQLTSFRNKELALAAYNMGPSKLKGLMNEFNVKDWSSLVSVAADRIPLETQSFVQKVVKFESEFKNLLSAHRML